jgi:hypothetical protein
MKVLFDDIPKELAPFVKAYNERAKKDEACIHCAC